MRDLNELKGIIEGINFDGVINDLEEKYLQYWANMNRNLAYNKTQIEIVRIIDEVLEDDVITQEEQAMLVEKLDQCMSESAEEDMYMQELNGIIEGIICDKVINEYEIKNLRKWMLGNYKHLNVDHESAVILTEIEKILKDGIVTESEQQELLTYLKKKIMHYRINDRLKKIRKKVEYRENIGLDLIDILNNEDAMEYINKSAEDVLIDSLEDSRSGYVVDPEIVFISLCLIGLLEYDGNYYRHVFETYDRLSKRFSAARIEGKIRSVISSFRSIEEIRRV